MESVRLAIVQPWFTAFGHPAQSTLNTARILGVRKDVLYVVEDPHGQPQFESMVDELQRFSLVHRFRTVGSSLAMKTLCASAYLARTLRDFKGQVLFLDASLLMLSAVWPLIRRRTPSKIIVSVLFLRGPEDVVAHRVKYFLVKRFLLLPEVRLYLRTEELAAAWRAAFKEVDFAQIDTIPSLEIPDEPTLRDDNHNVSATRFGLIGQIRSGKSIEWLVPMFSDNPGLGELNIAGQYFAGREGELGKALETHTSFRNQYLSDREMIELASSQDYLIVLYENWDVRMEAATLFLAARSGMPVIVYDEGWCGRMVREYGCGIAVARHPRPTAQFFRGLPLRGSQEYKEFVEGIRRFRDTFSGQRVRADFIAKCGLSESVA